MSEPFQKLSEEFQKMGKDGFDSTVGSYGELNKGFQAIVAKVADYSKKAFEDATRAWGQLIGAKSVEEAIDIQSQYAKKAHEAYVAELYRFNELYVDIAREAYKPVEQALAKKPPKAASGA